MILDARSISILSDLINADDYVKTSDLAQKYKVTDRTIRYNLDKIEKFLVKNKFEFLDKNYTKGVRLLKNEGVEKFVKDFIGEYTPYKYVYSKEEKFIYTITELLQSKGPMKIEFFDKKLCISKNTFLKDLDIIKEYLKSKNLNLIKKPRVGIYIDGSEKDKRRVLKDLASEKDLEREFNDEAYGNLITHVAIMIKRIQLNKNIYLPDVDIESIVETKEYEIAKRMIIKIEQHYDIKVPKEEIGYISFIALHFGSALENARAKKDVLPRVILVCGTGIGTAQMLATQLRKSFNVDIVNTVSSRAICHIESDSYDYIISTIDIPELQQKDYIKVNSILIKRDYEILKRYFNMKYIKESKHDMCMNKVNELIDVVSNYCEISDIYKLQYEFMKILINDVEDFHIKTVQMMNDLLKPNFIKLNVNCVGWKEAIKEAFDKGGPYMVVAPGVVLAHASPDSGVLKLSMSLITLKEPIDFSDDFNEGVKLIITLAATDKESHLKVLAQLMKLFYEKKDLRKVIDSNTKENVLEIINKYSDKDINF